MDQSNLIALGLGLAVAILHFLGESIKIPSGSRHFRLISFAAGISIGYLFLDLLPQTYSAAEQLQDSVFLFLLLAFSLVYLVEKYFYQHSGGNAAVQQRLKAFHTVTFFVYYYLIGIVLPHLIQTEFYQGVLFIIPVALHAALIGASLAEVHGQFSPSRFEKIVISLGVPLGVISASLMPVTALVYNIVISGIAGVMLYVFVREFLPEREQGQPLFFVLGLVTFFALMQLLHRIFA
jgi:zinc transporter ZupT